MPKVDCRMLRAHLHVKHDAQVALLPRLLRLGHALALDDAHIARRDHLRGCSSSGPPVRCNAQAPKQQQQHPLS